MPILDIEIVILDSAGQLPANLTQDLADASARIFGTPQGTVWVKVREILSSHYAEDHGTPPGVFPVFVYVLKAKTQKGPALEEEIRGLTQAIAGVLQRPDTNVHIIYQPNGEGRVAFGGNLVKPPT